MTSSWEYPTLCRKTPLSQLGQFDGRSLKTTRQALDFAGFKMATLRLRQNRPLLYCEELTRNLQPENLLDLRRMLSKKLPVGSGFVMNLTLRIARFWLNLPVPRVFFPSEISSAQNLMDECLAEYKSSFLYIEAYRLHKYCKTESITLFWKLKQGFTRIFRNVPSCYG
jgi:hypothetical protein